MMKPACIIFILIMLYSCNGYYENKYKLRSIEARLISVPLQPDTNGCFAFIDYCADSSNYRGAIAFHLVKEFYADNTSKKSFNTTQMKGLDGSDKAINAIEVTLHNGKAVEEITHLLNGDKTFGGFNSQYLHTRSYQITSDGCVFSESYKDIIDFISNYNSNSESVKGERLMNNEVVLFFDKRKLSNNVCYDSVQVQIQFVE